MFYNEDMSDILNEKLADKTVNAHLSRHRRQRLKGLQQMGKLLFDGQGNLYLADSYEQVSAADVDKEVQRVQDDIAKAEDIISELKSTVAKAGSLTDAQPATDNQKADDPAPVADIPQEQPAQPQQEQPQAAPEQPSQQPEAQPEQPQPQPEAQPDAPAQPQPIVLQ